MTDEFNLAHAAYMREYDRLRDAEASGATSGLGGPNALSLVHRNGGSKAAQQLTIGLAQGLKSATTSATNSCWRSSASPPRPSARPIQAILALATATQARPEPRPARYLPAPPPRPLRPVYGPPVAAPRPRPGPYERFDQLRRGPPPPPAPAAQAPARDPPSPSVLAMLRQDARRRPQQEPAARPVAAAQAPVAPPRPAAAPQLRVRYDKDAPEYREYYESDPREYDQYEDGQYD
ncbi:hypothetical protein MCOR02_001209 [Pyricularia oryzae]|nr:hypothetical protein MCOR02_012466 [Pyricularia oryzae]KAH9427151.1 hypothetical protein MCOR02_012444 [Pyricularia oryzae]KAH9429462.1 hypothetical protein MCOR02_009196 [Pyricularia oryzae]KAH9433002.1 hypothetical protein MCOR02_007674 [Pyricularia oryzae]KAH9434624.1 hypothetical protein MCOR02_006619 [Pyricularia oryzae]